MYIQYLLIPHTYLFRIGMFLFFVYYAVAHNLQASEEKVATHIKVIFVDQFERQVAYMNAVASNDTAEAKKILQATKEKALAISSSNQEAIEAAFDYLGDAGNNEAIAKCIANQKKCIFVFGAIDAGKGVLINGLLGHTLVEKEKYEDEDREDKCIAAIARANPKESLVPINTPSEVYSCEKFASYISSDGVVYTESMYSGQKEKDQCSVNEFTAFLEKEKIPLQAVCLVYEYSKITTNAYAHLTAFLQANEQFFDITGRSYGKNIFYVFTKAPEDVEKAHLIADLKRFRDMKRDLLKERRRVDIDNIERYINALNNAEELQKLKEKIPDIEEQYTCYHELRQSPPTELLDYLIVEAILQEENHIFLSNPLDKKYQEKIRSALFAPLPISSTLLADKIDADSSATYKKIEAKEKPVEHREARIDGNSANHEEIEAKNKPVEHRGARIDGTKENPFNPLSRHHIAVGGGGLLLTLIRWLKDIKASLLAANIRKSLTDSGSSNHVKSNPKKTSTIRVVLPAVLLGGGGYVAYKSYKSLKKDPKMPVQSVDPSSPQKPIGWLLFIFFLLLGGLAITLYRRKSTN